MRNLMLFIREDESLDLDAIVRNLRLQVENSLELGWRAADFLLYTNFPFEHLGVSAIPMETSRRPANARLTSFYKTFCILRALDTIADDEIVWYHDVDAYQLRPFEAPEFKGLVAFTLYSTRERLVTQGGSMFLRKASRPIFEAVMHKLEHEKYRKDEFALTDLTADPRFLGAFHQLDYSWNTGDTDFALRYQLAQLEPKVVHFHFDKLEHRENFLLGKNSLGVRPLDDRFLRLVEKHGFMEAPRIQVRRRSLAGKAVRAWKAGTLRVRHALRKK